MCIIMQGLDLAACTQADESAISQVLAPCSSLQPTCTLVPRHVKS